MSAISTIPSQLQENLPPCIAPMAEEFVQMIKNFWPKSGILDRAKSYCPLGECSCYNMATMVGKGKKISNISPGKAALTEFTNEVLKPGVKGFHHLWQGGGLACESLGVSGSTEIFTECYEGEFTGRLLSRVCKVYPSYSERALKAIDDMEFSSIARGICYVAGAAGLYKATQAYRAGNKTRALGWATMSVAAVVLPNIE